MESVRAVAEKSGIAVPRQRENSPEERREQQQRTALVEMHREAAAFFGRELSGSPEGKAARADILRTEVFPSEVIAQFGIGYAPSAGDALARHLKAKYSDKLLESSGLVEPRSRWTAVRPLPAANHISNCQ